MPNLSTFPLQGKAEEQSQNILGWEEKSKQPITAFFDFANLPCPEGETLKGSVNTIIARMRKTCKMIRNLYRQKIRSKITRPTRCIVKFVTCTGNISSQEFSSMSREKPCPPGLSLNPLYRKQTLACRVNFCKQCVFIGICKENIPTQCRIGPYPVKIKLVHEKDLNSAL